jgi:hypothetical protein
MRKLSRRKVVLSGVGLPLVPVGGKTAPLPDDAGNGYPELLRAAELLKSSARFEAVSSEKFALLAEKRAALAEPSVLKAAGVLEQALSRPKLFSPPEEDINSRYPAVAMRRLVRHLCMRQYVSSAGGDLAGTIRDFDLGLQVVRAAQSGPIIAGLLGISLTEKVVTETASHLEQLTPSDCETLVRLCRAWLAKPSLVIATLNREEAFARQMLAREHQDKTQRAAEYAQVQTLFDQLFHHQRAEARKPTWERSNPLLEIPGIAAFESTRDMADILTGYLLVHDASPGRLRLLACHALIRRFVWERNRLPASLAEVAPGNLAIDPFTGTALRYEKQSTRRYRLSSVGWLANRDEDGEEEKDAVDGRIPLTLLPD